MTSYVSFAKSSRCEFVSKALRLFNSNVLASSWLPNKACTGDSLAQSAAFSGFEFILLPTHPQRQYPVKITRGGPQTVGRRSTGRSPMLSYQVERFAS
jgi:hypothetical protein